MMLGVAAYHTSNVPHSGEECCRRYCPPKCSGGSQLMDTFPVVVGVFMASILFERMPKAGSCCKLCFSHRKAAGCLNGLPMLKEQLKERMFNAS